MSRLVYCIKFGRLKSHKPYWGYIHPWNGVRDMETYSLTYLPPSFIDGVADRLGVKRDNIRHKLMFDLNGMHMDQLKAIVYLEKGRRSHNIHKRHELVNPTLVLGFDNKEDAEKALQQVIYFGQNEYPVYPIPFDEEECNYICPNIPTVEIVSMTEEEFNGLKGVETFLSDEDDQFSIYCGNNRQRNNERMFITISRNDWRF